MNTLLPCKNLKFGANARKMQQRSNRKWFQTRKGKICIGYKEYVCYIRAVRHRLPGEAVVPIPADSPGQTGGLIAVGAHCS